MYKEDLALNNLQWLICHDTKPNQTKFAKIDCFSLLYVRNEKLKKKRKKLDILCLSSVAIR